MSRSRSWRLALIVLLVAAAPLRAQQPTPQQLQEILQQVQQNPEHFQRLMQQANEMQACLSQLDPATMDRLRVRGEEMVADIRALCVAGDRDMGASPGLVLNPTWRPRGPSSMRRRWPHRPICARSRPAAAWRRR